MKYPEWMMMSAIDRMTNGAYVRAVFKTLTKVCSARSFAELVGTNRSELVRMH